MTSSSMGRPTTVENGIITMGSSGKAVSCTLKYTGTGETTDRIMDISFNSNAGHNIYANGTGLLKFTSTFVIHKSSGSTSGGITLRGSGDGEISAGLTGDNLPGRLDKDDAGTWTLGGTNTANTVNVKNGRLIADGSLTGRTSITVSGGALELTSGTSLADTTALTISSGEVQLNGEVQQKVDSLTLGSTTMDPGMYGSSASSAANKDDTYFSGTGVLYVGVDIPSPAPSGTVITIK